MKFSAASLAALIAIVPAFVAAGPVAKRAVLTGQWDTESECSGLYTLENDQWGIAGYTGSQSAQAISCTSGTKLAWETTYTWTGGSSQVKSYTNVALNTGLGKKLSAITSIPTTWYWTYTKAASGLVADVSYDLWLSATAGTTGASSSSSYEIMIWLSARGGAGPAGSQIATVTIDGYSWALYKGTVSTWTVFSFKPASASTEITGFNTDLKAFFTYLTTSQGVSSSQYLVQVQAGTEPFISATATELTTTQYSIAIN
ncbi:hypothetical protein FRB94_001345 [Tulasnella sp. JGI-2019a]|nr:hypothetical protein FRB93_000619 [Tulasnella sp. JGI-2019a]KAG9005702.1 hypothetical protein FRB94_001345 [Tulasnella sp. JGI-2019a]